MSLPKLPKGYSKYGADMGRVAVHAADREATIKFHLVRERLDSGGYDSAGAYWGLPDNLYRVRSSVEVPAEPLPGSGVTRAIDHVEFFVRANTRGWAKQLVQMRTNAHGQGLGYIRATFFR